MKKHNKLNRSIVLLVFILAIVRVYLQSIMPLYPLDNYGVDDLLMVRYADWLGDNNLFLGEYSFYTLLKLPGYGIYLWMNNALGFRYSIFLGILYSVSCVVLFRVVNEFTDSPIKAFITFVLTLLCPVMFDWMVAGRIYCISLVPALTVLIVSSYIGIIARLQKDQRQIGYLIMAGMTYGFYRITRYDFIWMTLFMIGVSFVICIIIILKNNRTNCIKKAFVLLVPFIIGVSMTNVLKMINQINYGVYASSDFNETHFAEMCKYIMLIEPVEESAGAYVSMDTLHRAADVSPNLNLLVDLRDREGWDGLNEEGDPLIDLYAWNMRYSALDLGLYDDATSVDEFYGQICEDLIMALDDGRLKKRNVIAVSPFSAPFTMKEIPLMVEYSVFEGLNDVVHFFSIESDWKYTAFGSEDLNTMMFEDYTNEEFVSENELRDLISFSGWMFPKETNKDFNVSLVDKYGKEKELVFVDSSDVYNAYGVEQAKNARFYMAVQSDDDFLADINSISIRIRIGDQTVYEELLINTPNSMDIDGVEYYFDNIEYRPSNDAAIQTLEKNQRNKELINSTLAIVKKMSWGPLIVSAIIIIMELILCIRNIIKREKQDYLPIGLKLGLIFTMWIIVLMQSERNFQEWSSFSAYYSSGAYVVYCILISFCLHTIIDWGRKACFRTDSQLTEK